MSQSPLDRQQRVRMFEEFEQRLVMSAQSVADVSPTIDPQLLVDEILQQAEVTQQMADAHAQTGVDQVQQQYGFDGAGQTVVVIDSGIAWDHYALGNGYGSDYRVVGGWDFAENDANPYDDGPAGYHGTHVSGIIGSDDASNPGVATGVDLVGLRVFDDAGNGSLDWIEDALQWVHENKDNFENPITTVNLSLGTSWNEDTVPDWAELEDEFAQLERDGMFISVAAGNSFREFNTTGLSYPAVSPYVVPVASHGADGQMSDFSQRDDRVLVAPGESIRSTVPGHMFGGMTQNQMLGSSGTSMAAPYVAGASTLLRQANEFMGIENINQDLLYQQFRETAEQFWDAATQNHYYRINVEAAIDAIVTDLHGDRWSDATNAGVLVEGSQMAGTIGKTTDTDVFEFRAAETGRMTFTIDTTHDLNAAVRFQGMNPTQDGNRVTIDVQAGQQYRFSIESNGGIGRYTIDCEMESGPAIDAVNLGSIVEHHSTRQINGDGYLGMQASQSGFLSIQVAGQQSGQHVRMNVYDAGMNRISSTAGQGELRVDVDADAGQQFFVELETNGQVRLDASNLVSLDDGRLVVRGTSGDDQIAVKTGNQVTVDVNGMEYQFARHEVDAIFVAGKNGDDTLSVVMANSNDQITIGVEHLYIANNDLTFTATGFETVNVDAGGGTDRATLIGSDQNDQLDSRYNHVTLSNDQFSNYVTNAERVIVNGKGGFDRAILNGTQGNDRFALTDDGSFLTSGNRIFSAVGFERTFVNGGGGQDIANLNGSDGNDQFVMRPGRTTANVDIRVVTVNDFGTVNAIANGGHDSIQLYDSVGDDLFLRNGDYVRMAGVGFANLGQGFEQVVVHASAGFDLAQISDTHLADYLTTTDGQASLVNANTLIEVNDFDRVNVVATQGGNDRADLSGSNAADVVFANENSITVASPTSVNRAVGFDQVNFDGNGGNDVATLHGSGGNDRLDVNQTRVQFETAMQELKLENVRNTHFDGNGGLDEVIFGNMETLDLIAAVGDGATAYLAEHTVSAVDFDLLEATAADGENASYDIDAVDFLYMLRGNWRER